jgi:phytoene dehydrogenase-like protein
MSGFIGEDRSIHPDTLEQLRRHTEAHHNDRRYAAYQNHDLGARDAGHLLFLAIGPNCTYQTPPATAPDGAHGTGWRYVHVGYADLEKGVVVE